jgi:hypothetical protein
MASRYQSHDGIGNEDPLGLLGRATGRGPLQELRDYPFFAPEEEGEERTRTIRHGGAWLAALGLLIAIEIAVLIFLLR